jgi:hypothetical protein
MKLAALDRTTYPYFDVMAGGGGVEWSRNSESYAGGSIATGRAPMPDRSKVMIRTKKIPWSSGLGGSCVRLATQPHKTKSSIEKLLKLEGPPRTVMSE